MAPPRRCNCGKPSCFTCHRRVVNERYRAAHRDDPQPRHDCRKANGKFTPDVTDEELDRRALVMMGRTA
jgi:hypothetical protein